MVVVVAAAVLAAVIAAVAAAVECDMPGGVIRLGGETWGQ